LFPPLHRDLVKPEFLLEIVSTAYLDPST